MNIREEALRFIKYSVGLNSSFLLWHDQWLEGKPLIHNYDNNIFFLTGTSNMEQVGSLMDNTNWDLPRLNHMRITKLTSCIGLVRIRHQDSITWEDNIKVSISSIYHTIRSRANAPDWIKAV